MKFNEFKYEHLDFEDLKKQMEAYLEKIKGCGNSKEFLEVFEQINDFRGHVQSMATLSSIRHTINTADEFYDKENEYWDNTMPLLMEYEVALGKILLECPFKDELNIPEPYFLKIENLYSIII